MPRKAWIIRCIRSERSSEGKAKYHLKVLTSQIESCDLIGVVKGIFPLLAPVSDVVCLCRTRRMAILSIKAGSY